MIQSIAVLGPSFQYRTPVQKPLRGANKMNNYVSDTKSKYFIPVIGVLSYKGQLVPDCICHDAQCVLIMYCTYQTGR